MMIFSPSAALSLPGYERSCGRRISMANSLQWSIHGTPQLQQLEASRKNQLAWSFISCCHLKHSARKLNRMSLLQYAVLVTFSKNSHPISYISWLRDGNTSTYISSVMSPMSFNVVTTRRPLIFFESNRPSDVFVFAWREWFTRWKMM